MVESIAAEVSMLTIACGIDIDTPNAGERVLRNDETICGRKNPEAFQKLRRHLMALFPLEEQAIEELGAATVKQTMDRVREEILKRRAPTGGPESTTSD